jgi:hypothetical protein
MTPRRDDPSKGGYAVRVPIERPARKLPSQNRLAAKLKAAAKEAESVPTREPTQADLDRHSRMQALEQRDAEMMRDFRDSTRMRYMQGGKVEAHAKGGKVKGAAKISKVMGEFKRGELHSGSKKGPKVTNPKQAKAIALSEARAAGAKTPAPKKRGVPVASREPMIKRAEGGPVKPCW